MDYDRAISILRGSNILAQDRKLEYGMGKVRIHSRFETMEHFITKALVSFIIYQKGGAFMSEAECHNGRVLDILQVTKNKNLVAYEIETVHNGKVSVEGVDIVEVPLKDMPEKAKDGLKELEKWLKQYIV
jgi:hypothetical protein